MQIRITMKSSKNNSKKPYKRILLIGFVAVLTTTFLVVGISSCSRASYYQLALDNLSEARFYMKQDESDSLKVQFYSGMREEPYSTNGISEKTTAFGIINVDPKTKILDGLIEIDGTLKIGDELLAVKLEKNPYAKNFGCDIAKLVDVDKPLSLTLTIDNGTSIPDTIVFNLVNCMPEDAISWEDALKIATDHHTSEIKKAGKFECYVKIISDLVKNTGSYWYIQFATQKGSTFFCVIDSSGKVIS